MFVGVAVEVTISELTGRTSPRPAALARDPCKLAGVIPLDERKAAAITGTRNTRTTPIRRRVCRLLDWTTVGSTDCRRVRRRSLTGSPVTYFGCLTCAPPDCDQKTREPTGKRLQQKGHNRDPPSGLQPLNYCPNRQHSPTPKRTPHKEQASRKMVF